MGTLGELAQREPVIDGDDAGTVVIGEVVRVGQQLAGRLGPAAREVPRRSDFEDSMEHGRALAR